MTIISDYLSLTIKYKKEYSDKTLLLMQVGSFFECYAIEESPGIYSGSDILSFSEINDMVIAKKNTTHNGKQVVMAGFGVTQLEKYVKRLQEHNYTVVVYTQDSNTKNTTRSLSCIYSPGTFFNNESINNITTCIILNYSKSNQALKEYISIGCASIDIFTGKTNIYEYSIEFLYSPTTYDNLERYLVTMNPSECILIGNYSLKEVENLINNNINSKIHIVDNKDPNVLSIEKQKFQQEIIKTFYNEKFDFENYSICTQSFCYLLQFIYKHNPNLIKKIENPELFSDSKNMILANSSLQQLNVISDNRYSGKKNSLLSFLNNCITIIGKRAFKDKLLRPIFDKELLKKSYDEIDICINTNYWKEIRNKLQFTKDIAKIHRKLLINKFIPKDFLIIYNTLNSVLDIYNYCDINLNFLNENNILVSEDCNNIINFIYNNFNILKLNVEELNIDKLSLKEPDDFFIFNKNYNDELNKSYEDYQKTKNELDNIIYNLNEILFVELNDKKKETEYLKIYETPKGEPVIIGTTRRLNILKKYFDNSDSIKMNFPKEFNYKIEIKTHNGSNSFIYNDHINKLLKNLNNYKFILINHIIKEFEKICKEFSEFNFKNIINYISETDLLQNKCYIAREYGYSKPIILDTIDDKSKVNFKGIRHPLIEHLNTNEMYVKNDLDLEKGILLYGTNAVGKSSFIKSVGLNIIMAQSGLYVACDKFEYVPFKSIFTRILGNDNIFKGLSTFAVEMSELRSILKYSNNNSLILGDELCSGTESTSAISIFTASLEFLKEQCFIFATHFHEIINFPEIKDIRKFHMTVIYNKEKNCLVYDRKLKEGSGDSMYGLEVCKSLDLPIEFLDRAHKIRENYTNIKISTKVSRYNSEKILSICEICKINNGVEFHHLLHQKVYSGKYKNHKANLISICEECHNKIHKDDLILKKSKTLEGEYIIN